MQAKQFLSQLPPVYWSKHHPATYTIRKDGNQVGVGRLACQDLGAWNLVHDRFDWATWAGHEKGVMAWSLARQALTAEVAGAPLTDTVVALGPQRWPTWWKENRASLATGARQQVDNLMGLRKATA